eukprot:scaffold70564_cov62-Cyclotella_meneghiniana.AAC.1
MNGSPEQNNNSESDGNDATEQNTQSSVQMNMARGGEKVRLMGSGHGGCVVRKTWGSHMILTVQNTRASERGEGGELEVLPLRFRHHTNKEKTTGNQKSEGPVTSESSNNMETAKPASPGRAYVGNGGLMTKDNNITVNSRAETSSTDKSEGATVAAALLGGRANVGIGGLMLKDNVKKMMMVQRLSRLTDHGDEKEGDDLVVPKPVLNRWRMVAEGSDVHNLTNKDLYDALEPAKKYFHTKAGKDFIDNNLDDIVRHLLSQSPRNLSITRDNVGQSEYAMVEKSIRFALVLIVEDLRTNANKLTTQCDQTLHALGLILDYKSLYYEESPATVRMDKILVFQRLKGFYYLGVYLNARFNTSSFPEWVVIHRALKSAREGIEASDDDEDGQKNFRKL